MPTISMFYGIMISIFYDDHNPPHFHAKYQDNRAVFDMNGNLIKGNFPDKQKTFVAAWALLHQEELLANWELAENGEQVFQIAPLR